MNNFSYRGAGLATINSLRLSGAPGVGRPHLLVEIAVTMQPASAVQRPDNTPAPLVVAIHGDLSIGKVLVAPLETSLVEWHCVNHAQQNREVLRAFVSFEQIRAIDALRTADGGFNLDIWLQAQIQGYDGLLPAPLPGAIRENVTASDWTRILREMKFEDRVTFEVPVDGGRVGPPLDKAAAYMRAALDKLQMRQWDDALTKCREVLTELQQFESTPAPGWADWADRPKREAWTPLERVAALQAAARHATHPGAHASIGVASEHEVRLVVTMTGALLRYCASR